MSQKIMPFKDRRKPNVYYDEDNKFTLKRRGEGKRYDYIEITGWLKKAVPLDDLDKEADSWFEMDVKSDRQVEVFVALKPVTELKQLEYLVLALMGYQLAEMPKVLEVKGLGSVRDLKDGLAKTLSETAAFSL